MLLLYLSGPVIDTLLPATEIEYVPSETGQARETFVNQDQGNQYIFPTINQPSGALYRTLPSRPE